MFVFLVRKKHWQKSIRKMLVTMTRELPKLLFMARSLYLGSITSTDTDGKLYNDIYPNPTPRRDSFLLGVEIVI